MEHSRHRRCIVVRGSPEQTRARARTIVELLDGDRVLWVGEGDLPPSALQRMLGQGFDAVILDLHGGLHADALGISHGLVWGGGALLLRMPPAGEIPAGPDALAVYPHSPAEIGGHLWRRLERSLAQMPLSDVALRLRPVERHPQGTDGQRAAIDALAAFLGEETPGMIALLADRGRGKSSALGLVAAMLAEQGHEIVVTAEQRTMADELLRHAKTTLRFVSPDRLACEEDTAQIVLVDEAAALPVPLLRQIAAAQRHARFALASTTHGYEGTGRGFTLRFLAEAARWPRFRVLTLREPIRWAAGDPLERLVFDALLLDAEAAEEIDSSSQVTPEGPVERGSLCANERDLHELFGLLIAAHYRTTPSDLHRLLDAPNLSVYLSRDMAGHIVAACLVAREGALPRQMSEALYRGERRIRGHALPETLIVHAGHLEAGDLSMIRSVRIAVHPALRRRAIARDLVGFIHAAEEQTTDLFGTVFGATPELLRFRRSLGYEVVRLGSSRGTRSGEPSVVMMRPVSPRAETLFQSLRAELARDLPLQLELMGRDSEVPLDPVLLCALQEALPSPAPLPDEEVQRIVSSYTAGPRPYDLVATAVSRYVASNTSALRSLDSASARLIAMRVLERRSWASVASTCDLPSIPAAMRALRRAIVRLQETRQQAASIDSEKDDVLGPTEA